MARLARRLARRFGRGARWALLLAALGIAVICGWTAWSASQRAELARVEAWAPQILVAARLSQLDPFLLAGLVYAESRGRADAVSSVGARGLCQLKDATAEEMADKLGISGDAPFPPEKNLILGAAYLSLQIARMGGDVDLGLLCYRLGPGRVARELDAAGGAEAWLTKLRATSEASPWHYCEQVRDAAERMRSRDRMKITQVWSDASGA